MEIIIIIANPYESFLSAICCSKHLCIFSPILEMRKLRHKEATQTCPGNTTSNVTMESVLFITAMRGIQKRYFYNRSDNVLNWPYCSHYVCA
jgi:hypothetical protein